MFIGDKRIILNFNFIFYGIDYRLESLRYLSNWIKKIESGLRITWRGEGKSLNSG